MITVIIYEVATGLIAFVAVGPEFAIGTQTAPDGYATARVAAAELGQYYNAQTGEVLDTAPTN